MTSANSFSASDIITAYTNLTPVNPAVLLRGNSGDATPNDMENLFSDGAESLTADVWNIFMIRTTLANQKLLQFKLTNNSGGESAIQFAYLRVA